MRRPAASELAALLAGVSLLAAAAFVLHVPPAVHPLWIAKARAGKAFCAAGGLLLLVLAWRSWRRSVPLLAGARFRERLARLALIAASAAVTVVLVELVLEWVTPEPPANWIRPDARLHHAQKEDFSTRFITTEWNTAVVTNGLGLRDEEPAAKAAGATRVLVLGDSYTFGYGVEAGEAYPQVVETLAATRGWPLEIINAAVPSYSPTLEAVWLRDVGLALEPDVVVLALDMSDFQDDLFLEPLVEWGTDGEPLAVRPSPRPGWLGERYKSLLLVRMLRFAADRAYARLRSGTELDAPQTRELAHNRFALTRDDLAAEQEEPHYRRTLGWIERARRLTVESGVRFLVLTYPYGHQVSPREWEAGRHHYGFAARKVYGDEPARRLCAWAAERAVPCLDMFPAFRAAADGSYYFAQDGHFTPEAHRLAAELLLARLAELGWAGPAPAP